VVFRKQIDFSKEVATIATLPSREILIGKVMGGIQGPLYALMNQVNAPLRVGSSITR